MSGAMEPYAFISEPRREARQCGFTHGMGFLKPSLPHNPTHTRVIQNGDDQLLHLNLHGQNRLLLALYRPASLVRLGALEGGPEGVGNGRALALRPEHGARRGSGEAVEGNIEAKLQSFALERVRMGLQASAAKQAGRRGEHGVCHVERGDLSVAAPPSERHGLFYHGCSLWG
nr:hypothetical protein PanWU01x14_012550 [Ipomoea trifida]